VKPDLLTITCDFTVISLTFQIYPNSQYEGTLFKAFRYW